jgi:NTP pyrophosphatase (non-canonical NTP hydrolase)
MSDYGDFYGDDDYATLEARLQQLEQAQIEADLNAIRHHMAVQGEPLDARTDQRLSDLAHELGDVNDAVETFAAMREVEVAEEADVIAEFEVRFGQDAERLESTLGRQLLESEREALGRRAAEQELAGRSFDAGEALRQLRDEGKVDAPDLNTLTGKSDFALARLREQGWAVGPGDGADDGPVEPHVSVAPPEATTPPLDDKVSRAAELFGAMQQDQPDG